MLSLCQKFVESNIEARMPQNCPFQCQLLLAALLLVDASQGVSLRSVAQAGLHPSLRVGRPLSGWPTFNAAHLTQTMYRTDLAAAPK
jgi:hypothetical protein